MTTPGTADRTVVRARYVVPMVGPPLENGWVLVQGERILEVGRGTQQVPGHCSISDQGDVALLPALVNAHTHLEFSDRLTPYPRTDESFTAWLRQVIAARNERTVVAAEPSAIERGKRELAEHCTARVGEISTSFSTN
ncbi:MAG: hypothetical protein KDA60_08100, partial [Planctomycetales bacterium]|nr:hypothetical protein [Planctomycetales bacterium]